MTPGPDDFDYLQHIYTQGLKPTYDMIYQWRAVIKEYEEKDKEDRVMLVEAYAGVKEVMIYFGNDTTAGADLPFNFEWLQGITNESDARDMKFFIDKWLTYMPINKTANWVVS